MPTKIIVRGNTIVFQTRFYDLAGEPANPASATLHVAYALNGASVTDDLVMSMADDLWSASWESRISDPCRVTWSVRSGESTPFSAEDGSFVLSANAANPGP